MWVVKVDSVGLGFCEDMVAGESLARDVESERAGEKLERECGRKINSAILDTLERVMPTDICNHKA